MLERQRYVIYARGHRPPDVHRRIYVPIFTDPAVAKAWVTFFLDGEETARVGDRLTLGSGIELQSEQLDTILSCPDIGDIKPLDERRILRFKHGTWDERHEKPVAITNDGTKTAPRVVREQRAARPTGFITITELCAASGVPAMNARACLRASGLTKPDYGWAFDPKDVPRIKTICGMK